MITVRESFLLRLLSLLAGVEMKLLLNNGFVMNVVGGALNNLWPKTQLGIGAAFSMR